MKSKSKHAPLKRKKEFRSYGVYIKNRRGKLIKYAHPAFVFLEKGNVYFFVTITHSNTVTDHLVIQLHKNPNPNDKNKAFWVADIREDTKDRFGKKRSDWKIDPLDDKAIRELFEKEKR